ncbi:hypothetical protein LCL95_04895 [Bacillus timonensis]|nr:hypothetical protein [Bacillus timonensis]
MQLYFSPELMANNYQLLNIVDQNNNPLGYVTFLFDQEKMYVHGLCENEGICEDFKELLKPYLKGLSKIKSDLDIYAYISVGGKKIDCDIEEVKK